MTLFLLKTGAIVTVPGGTVAAPLVGEIMEQSLTYLGINRDYENQIEKNLRWFLDTPTYKVDNYIGKTKKKIKNTLFYNYVYYGEGDTVIYQSPDQGEKKRRRYYNVIYGMISHPVVFFLKRKVDKGHSNINKIENKVILSCDYML